MIDLKRKELDLMRVCTAKFELELKIEEMTNDIERLKKAIVIQEETEVKIKQEIEKLKRG